MLIKIGGSTLGSEDTTLQDLAWLQAHGHEPIVVHGGGKVITQWLERMQVSTRFVNGLRVTDEQSIDVVVAVLAGVVNKQLVAQINAAGGKAVGLSGVDGAVLQAKVKDAALGLVGEVTKVNAAPIEALLKAGYIPVIAPIGIIEGKGATLLNINADTAAGAIGAAVKATTFVFLTDVPGVRDASGKVVSRLTSAQVRELIALGVIRDGMVPKAEACLAALKHVPSTVILDGRQPHALRALAEGKAVGTRVE